MAESKVRDDSYFVVCGWMINRLGLKGTALHLFAIIYGFSQDGEGSFTGSLQYLCDFTNTTKKTVISALKELTEKRYITKTENVINGVKFNTYRVFTPVVEKLHRGSEEITPGVVEKLHRGSEEITPNNKDYNKSLKNKEIVKEVIDLYHTICKSYPKVKVLSGKREKEILARMDTYSLEDMRTVFTNAESSSFMKGKNDRGWAANFDWMMNENNIVKILEGNYADKGRKEKVPGWMEHSLGDAEMEAIRRVMAQPDPDLEDRAQRLRESLGQV